MNSLFLVGGNNALHVGNGLGNITFDGGGNNGKTTLSFNVTDSNYISHISGAAADNAALNLNGQFNAKNGKLNIDIASINSQHDSGLGLEVDPLGF